MRSANKGRSLSTALALALCFSSSLLLTEGCDDYSLGDYPPRYGRFFSGSLEQQMAEFEQMPVEEQITIHIFSVTERHPPFTGFGRRLAARGPAVTEALLTRLQNVTDDWEKAAIIQVFSFMPHVPGSADGRAVVARLRTAAATIKDDAAAESAASSIISLERSGSTR